MASAEILEFATLLEPIPGDNPTGADLRADGSPSSPYYGVKDARSQARAAERQIVMDGEETANSPDWRPVMQRGVQVLSQKSKDLEVTAYLIEGLVRLHGFPGLRDGFRLARELVERYWDGLYPQPDEDGLLTRVAPLAGLNGGDSEGTLIQPIAKIPLTEGSSAGPYTQNDFQKAAALARVADPEARQKQEAQAGMSLERFEKAVAETPADFFANLVDDLTQCQEEFTRLTALLDEKCGSNSPPSSNIRAALAACLDTVNSTARDKLLQARPPAAGEEAAAAAGEAGAAQGNGAAGVPAGAIRNRDEAFSTLLKLAEFFRRTEPHNPVSYALEQAVRWGRMTLPEFLSEMIGEEGMRSTLFKHVGINPTPPAE
jgi:type VI secretion system protein ImpA